MSVAPASEPNPYASPKSAVVSDETSPLIEFAGYAGFGRRFAAWLIDGIVGGLIAVTLTMMSGFVFALLWGLVVGLRWGNVDENFAGLVSALLGVAVGVVSSVVYHAAMESSPLRATVGKLLLGVKVTDLSGRRIPFVRALGRFAGKIVSFLILGIGFVMAAFTEKHQALHDLIAGTLVMKVQSAADPR
jgi:uncharacterized RDD family membrane protein YckC